MNTIMHSVRKIQSFAMLKQVVLLRGEGIVNMRKAAAGATIGSMQYCRIHHLRDIRGRENIIKMNLKVSGTRAMKAVTSVLFGNPCELIPCPARHEPHGMTAHLVSKEIVSNHVITELSASDNSNYMGGGSLDTLCGRYQM
jgi:hypothetical protein